MAEIKLSDLTEGIVSGAGVFDEMQTAAAAHIQEEYERNRIRGPEYSQVYLGGMQSAMQNAVAFLLGRQKADKEAELIAEKIDTEVLLQDKIRQEILLLQKQIQKTQAEIWVIKAQIMDDVTRETPKTTVYGLMGKQKDKLTEEIGLLSWKTKSEKAQTINEAQDQSVLGKEILLRQRQADGFLRDAEQKAAKIASDIYSVQFSTLDGEVGSGSIPYEFTAQGLASVVGKMNKWAADQNNCPTNRFC